MTTSSSVPPDLLGMRYRPSNARTRGHIESWFLKANEPDGRRAFWTRCTIFASPPLGTVAEAWTIAFDRHRGHIAVKSTVLFDTARFATDKVDVEVDGCSIALESPELGGRARGALSSGRGSLAWDVAISGSLAPPIFHIPHRAMYRESLPPFSKAVTPIPDARANGALRIDRGGGDIDTWEVDDWPMMLGHNWGRANAELYAWTHCNAFDVEGLAFEAISTRLRVGPLLTPMTTVAFVRFRGKSWDLSRVRALGQNRGSISLRRWEMTGNDRGLQVACEVAAETDDIVGLHYPNPSPRPMTHCLNTKLARARLELRFPDGETITAMSRAAALEIGTIQSDHGIRMIL